MQFGLVLILLLSFALAPGRAVRTSERNEVTRIVNLICDETFRLLHASYSSSIDCPYGECDDEGETGSYMVLDLPLYGCQMSKLTYFDFTALDSVTVNPLSSEGLDAFLTSVDPYTIIMEGTADRLIFQTLFDGPLDLNKLDLMVYLEHFTLRYSAVTSLTVTAPVNMWFNNQGHPFTYTVTNNPNLATFDMTTIIDQFFYFANLPDPTYELPLLDISHNPVLSSGFPAEAMDSTRLLRIDASYTAFTAVPSYYTSIQSLDLSHSAVTSLPSSFGCSYSPWEYCRLRLAGNNIVGTLPPYTDAANERIALDLSDNLIVGTIPSTWLNVHAVSLNLANNFLSGPLPSINALAPVYLYSGVYSNIMERKFLYQQQAQAGLCPISYQYPLLWDLSDEYGGWESDYNAGTAASCTPCAGTSPVANSPICSGYGTCVANSTSAAGYYCGCDIDHAGQWCQEESFCAANPGYCVHGTCSRLVLYTDTFGCVCDPEWTGTTCDISLNPCTAAPCQNGATCVIFNTTTYTCTCPYGYSGTNCSTVQNFCADSPCQNGGTCTSTPGVGYSCACPSGWGNANCSIFMINSGQRGVLDAMISTACDAAYQALYPTLGANPCIFPGINCTTDGFVTKLDFPAMPCLMGTINLNFGLLPQLKALVINPLDCTEFYQLLDTYVSLRRLELRGNSTRHICTTGASSVDLSLLNGHEQLNSFRLSYSRVAYLGFNFGFSFRANHLPQGDDGFEGPTVVQINHNPLLATVDGIESLVYMFSTEHSIVADDYLTLPLPLIDLSWNPLVPTSDFYLFETTYPIKANLVLAHTNASIIPTWQPFMAQLDLSYSQVTALPSSIRCESGNFPYYCFLGLAGNNIKAALPPLDPIYSPALDLSNNRIYGTISSSWSAIPLASLDLRGNLMSGPLPMMLFGGEGDFGSYEDNKGYVGRTAAFYQSDGAGFCPVYVYPNASDPQFNVDPYAYTDHALYGVVCTPCNGTSPVINAAVCNSAGTCIEDGGEDKLYRCSCGVNYQGEWCETPSVCANSTYCAANGTCTRTTEGSDTFFCNCTPGYEGTRCETAKNYCTGSPCQNGGTCTSIFNTGYTCSCTSAWSGTNCTTDVDECVTGNGGCQNGATCNNLQGGFNCTCPDGWAGALCSEESTLCNPSPCQNGGTCTLIGETSYSCACANGYSGTNCTTIRNFCSPNPCQNGGTCTSTPGVGYSCVCESYRDGVNCTEPVIDSAVRPDVTVLINAVCDSAYKTQYAALPFNICIQPGFTCDSSGYISELDFPAMPCLMTNLNASWNIETLKRAVVNPLSSVGLSGMLSTNSYWEGIFMRGTPDRLILQDRNNLTISNEFIYINKPYEIEFSYTNLTTIDIQPPESWYTDHSSLETATLIVTHNPHLTSFGLSYIYDFLYFFTSATFGSSAYPLPAVDLSYNPGAAASLSRSLDWATSQPNKLIRARIKMTNCNLTEIPEWASQAYYLDLSDNLITSLQTFPHCDSYELPGCHLSLTYNNMVGTIPAPTVFTNTSLSLDLSNNQLVGTLPPQIFNASLKLASIDVSGNWLSGPLNRTVYILGSADIGSAFTHLPQRRASFFQAFGAGFCPVSQYPNASTPTFYDDPHAYTDYQLYVDQGECTPCQGPGPEISSSPICSGAGTCVVDPTDSKGYHCECDATSLGQWCEVASVCATNTTFCTVHGSCDRADPEIDVFSCVCDEGWNGTRCEIPTRCTNGPCAHGESCNNTSDLPSFPLDDYCLCNSSYYGYLCEFDSLCVTRPCSPQGTCVRTGTLGNDFICACENGFKGTICDEEINYCDDDPCQNEGNCTSTVAVGYTCNCTSAWAGTNCTTDVDECATGNGGCLNGATCNNLPGSFNCSCPVGYSGALCQTYVCTTNPCQNNGTCIPAEGLGNYTCDCLPFYNGTTCQTFNNLCSPSPCLNGGNCSLNTTSEDFQCACRPNYSGPTCAIYDYCASSPCTHGGNCTNSGTSSNFTCACPPQWTGTTCQTDVNECTTQLSQGTPCLNGGTCSNSQGNYSCLCQPAYSGMDCEIFAGCLINPCQHNGTCISGVNNYTCSCTPDWTGRNCTTFVNGCAGNPCQHGATCISHLGQPMCTCTPNWTGTLCSIDVNECLAGNGGCLHGATCVNSPGSRSCICAPGYNGTICDNSVCTLNPCQRGGNCTVTQFGNYTCECPWAFPGPTCNLSKGVHVAIATTVLLGFPFVVVSVVLIFTFLV